MSTQLIRPSESAHWYTKQGDPLYEVASKSKLGEMRPTTLRDAKNLGLYPSVTSIFQVLARPGLEKWKQNQLVLSALTLPKEENESIDDFAVRVIADAEEHSKQAMEAGTAIHASIQASFEGKDVSQDHYLFVEATKEAMNDIWPSVDWICEKSFSHPFGFGGKVDAHSIKDRIVIDWKTSAFDEKKLPTGYDEHIMQLAAYAYGLGIEKPSLANVYISTTKPGLVHIVKWTEEDRIRGLEMFLAAFKLWKLIKRYNP